MITIALNTFLILIFLLVLLISVIIYIKFLENKRIKKYGEHYNEDHFREWSKNKEALVTKEMKKKYNLGDEHYRYKGIEYETNKLIFVEGVRDDDNAIFIEGDIKENLKIFTKRKFKQMPTKEEINSIKCHILDIKRIAIIKLKEGYFVLFLITKA